MKRPRLQRERPPFRTSRRLLSSFMRSGENGVAGFAVDHSDLNCKFTVEILIDGFPYCVVRADALVDELVAKQIGDGCYGFSYTLPEKVIADRTVVEARLANLGTIVGKPIVLGQRPHQRANFSSTGQLRWLGGLRFSGWILGVDQPNAANVQVDGIPISRIKTFRWSHINSAPGHIRVVRAFDFHLPERFADGRVHRLILTDDLESNLTGEPLSFIAYADGLRDALAERVTSEGERLRVDLFDRLLPMSLPFTHYPTWRDQFLTLNGCSAALRAAVITVGPGSTAETLKSLYKQTHKDWVAASIPHTEPMALPAKEARAFLKNAGRRSDFVVFTLAGTRFSLGALRRIAATFDEFETAQLVYADLDFKNEDGSIWPLAFSAFDHERMLEQGYCAYLFALRRATAMRLLNNGADNLYRLLNSIFDDSSVSSSQIVHIPGALATLPHFDKEAASVALAAAGLAYLDGKGIHAEAAMHFTGIFPSIQVKRKYAQPHTTVVISTRNRSDLLRNCIESILPAVERTNADILVVDNETTEPNTLAYLDKLENRGAIMLRVSGDFDRPRLNNRAVEAARGEIVCLLDSGVSAVDDFWLDEMLSRIVDCDVGAVGALLFSPHGVVQHGGIVLGPGFSATVALNDRPVNDPGYCDLLNVAHECSAVSGACLLTRKTDYFAVGGMDELRFRMNFSDVDFCLKLRTLGKRIVFTPHARLNSVHGIGWNCGPTDHIPTCFERELANLRAKWGNALAADPYYSPTLSLDMIPFSALAWPARSLVARLNDRPICTNIPAGF